MRLSPVAIRLSVRSVQATRKGHVKALPDLSLPSDLADVSAAATQAEHNAVRKAVNDLKAQVAELAGLKGKGTVLESDTTHALVALGA